jgi:hypothetical protein
MHETQRNLAIHEGLTHLQMMKIRMLRNVFRVIVLAVAIPLGLFLSLSLIKFVFHATDVLRGVQP